MERSRLRGLPLFRGMEEAELEDCLCALAAQERRYEKGEMILRAGSSTERMGIVLQGSVTVESNDVWGGCTILRLVGENGSFAETYALLEGEVMLVDVRANEDCRVLLLRLGDLSRGDVLQRSWGCRLIANLLIISTHKNLALSGRSFHTAPRTIRGRVLAYLNSIALRTHTREFDIPFDRQQLADYLNVDRTALSKELGKMREEGILRCRRSHFVLLRGGE